MKAQLLTYISLCIFSIQLENTNSNIIIEELLTTSPISYWSFDENTGCTAMDTNNNNNGTLSPNCTANVPLWVNGNMNSALSFDGNDDYVTIPNASNLNPESEITLAAWVKWSIHPTTGNSWAQIINKNGDQQYQIQHNHNNRGFELAIKTTTGRKHLIGNVVPQQNIWHFVVGTYDGQIMRLYVDGSLDVSTSWTGNLTSSTSPLEFGRRAINNDRHFNGTIDEVSIWDKALTENEVQILYSNGTLSHDQNTLQNISIYPNPTKDFLTVKVPNQEEKLNFKLYNVLGKHIDVPTKANSIDLNYLPSGVYLLEISSQNRRVIKYVIKE